MDTSIPLDTIIALEYPAVPLSPPRSPVPRSSLRVTTTINDSSIIFCPTPTPKSAHFSHLSPTFSRPPPTIPPQWLWRCHLCGISYPLGTTRRCLNDGHYFCAGVTISKKTGKRKMHSPCGSTFDYIGWEEYGDWRRKEQKLRARNERKACESQSTRGFSSFFSDLLGGKPRTTSSLSNTTTNDETDSESDHESPNGFRSKSPRKRITQQDCEHQCNYPSECRWGARVSPSAAAKEKKKKRRARTQSISTSSTLEKTVFASSSPSTDIKNESAMVVDRMEASDPDPDPDPDIIMQDQDQDQGQEDDLLPPLPEFNLTKCNIQRRNSFSLPFSSYPWLTVAPESSFSDPGSGASSSTVMDQH